MVLTMLCNGDAYTTILTAVGAEYGCAQRTVERDIAKVRRDELPKYWDVADQRANLLTAVARVERHIQRCIAAGQNHAALLAMKFSAELLGLRAYQQRDDTIGTLRQQLEQLRAEREDTATPGDGSIPLAQFNEIRALYGQPALTHEAFEEYRAQQKAAVDLLAVGGNGNGTRH
jgi:hypothetical protein